MAAAAVPSGRSLLGKVRAAAAARKSARDAKPSPVAAVLAKAREHVVTFAALGAFDMGAFQVHVPHCGSAPGWVAVCFSLLAAHFAVEG